MHAYLQPLVKNIDFTGDFRQDMQAFLRAHGCAWTADHCLQVAEQARLTALQFGADPAQAEQAGWLHDVSAVFPHTRRLEAAQALGLEVLPEEAAYPMILHQKLSVALAQELFAVRSPAVLSAIGCHTTLRAGASLLDKVVFIADKLAWDGTGSAPFYGVIIEGLARSLDEGVFAYLDYLWQRRATLGVVHPWLAEAHQEMSAGQRPSAPATG
jgi:predicted HD superfamily hydrolase involved in NAD metabolism